MIDQADQPRLAGMGALIGQMTIGSITSLIYSIVPEAAECSSGLLPDRFILQDERRR